MKKQTIISLAVCALSFGAIAAAVSAKEAVRADADLSTYYLHGQYGSSWDWTNLNLNEHEDHNQWYAIGVTFQTNSEFGFKAAADSSSWYTTLEDGVVNFTKASNGNLKCTAAGLYDIYFKADTKKVWIAASSAETVKVTKYLVTDGVKGGTSTSEDVTKGSELPSIKAGYGKTFGGWFTDEACTVAAGAINAETTVYGKVTTVTETKTFHFDVSAASTFATPYYHTWDEGGDKASWPGEAATGVSAGKFDLILPVSVDGVIITDGASEGTKQTVDIKDLDPDYTYKVLNEAFDSGTDAGKYKVNKVYNQPLPELSKVAGKIGTTDLVFTASTKQGTEDWDAQFEATITGEAGSVLSFTYDSAAIVPSIDTGANAKVESEQIKLIKGVTAKKIYLKSKGGEWSLWVEYMPIADGVYLTGLGTFDLQDVVAGDPVTDGNTFQKANVTLAAGDKFKIVTVTDNAFVWASSWGMSAVAYGATDNFEGDVDGNIVVKEGKGGTYDIFLKNNEITLNLHKDIPVLSKVGGSIGETALTFAASEKQGTDKWDAQFEATFSGTAGDELTFTYDSAAINPTLDGGENNVQLVETKIKLIKAVENKKLYLKSTDGVWSLWVEGNQHAPVADGLYLAGLKSFEIGDVQAGDVEKGDNDFQIKNLTLAAGDKFKIVTVKDDAIDWSDDKNWGMSAVKYGDVANFEADGDGNIVVKEGKGGIYDLYLKGGVITLNEHKAIPTLDKVAGKIGDTNLVFSASEKGEETWDVQFEATFSGAAGDELTFTYDSVAINPNLDEGANNVELVETKIKLIDAVEGKKLYLKSTAGVWSLWVEGKEVIEDGIYLVGDFNEWAFNAGSKSGTPSEGNFAEWQDVKLTAGQEFKVAVVNSNVKSWGGYEQTDDGCRSLFTKNTEEGPSNNNIIITSDGTYDIFVNDQAKIWVNKEAADPVYTGKVGTTDIALSAATVDPEYDGEDCLKKFEGIITCEDGAQLSFAKDGAAITTNIGKVETANLSDDLKVIKGGAGLIVQVKIYADWVGIWVSQPADTDLTAVRNFVNTYITSQGAEDYTTIPEADRNAKCVSKYQAAKAAYDALSEAQQDLFDTADEFTNPRAILAEWKAVVDAQSGVKAIARMSNPNMRTIAVVGSILAVGAIAAIGMIIFAKKRKAE